MRTWLGAAAAAVLSLTALTAHAAAPTPDHTTGGVTKADFDRLEGQVRDLQRRVAALEKQGGGKGGGGTKGVGAHKCGGPKQPVCTAKDNWENP